MSFEFSRLLKRRISDLSVEFSRLEEALDTTVRGRLLPSTPEQKRERSTVLHNTLKEMLQVERNLHQAKRLLARNQGDEYSFKSH